MIRALQQDWPSKNEAFSCDFTPLRAAVQNAKENPRSKHTSKIFQNASVLHHFSNPCVLRHLRIP